ncbi:chemotaxis protein CheD [Croceicoccus sp. YJ47]|uniref:chemotaxis protein CheD n=1 Tax=Croceicoccus sp. YJ47 TaxID=2798724 RepID=UPI001F33A65E|nr:chemotaxis protein CheD [Croceicoccus sp. YJ47]
MKHAAIPEVAERVRVTILQGEAKASDDPNVEFSTVLGSCVATCMFDPVARIGGMNHFLLAEPPSYADRTTFDDHYGLFLMELLVNEMFSLGAVKARMKARLYGGANLREGMAAIGSVNAAFARKFLRDEGIEMVHEDMEGRNARRVHFLPASGQVRCRTTVNTAAPTQQPLAPRKAGSGDVTLF